MLYDRARTILQAQTDQLAQEATSYVVDWFQGQGLMVDPHEVSPSLTEGGSISERIPIDVADWRGDGLPLRLKLKKYNDGWSIWTLGDIAIGMLGPSWYLVGNLADLLYYNDRNYQALQRAAQMAQDGIVPY